MKNRFLPKHAFIFKRAHGGFHVMRQTKWYPLGPFERFTSIEQAIEINVNRVSVR